MSVSSIAVIIFFGVYGLAYFFAFPYTGLILAVSALVAAVAMAMGK